MCDFSLEVFKSRAAEDNEDLVLKRFPGFTKGFVSAKEGSDQDCAVCCKSGVEMTVHLNGQYTTKPLDGVGHWLTEKFEGDIPATFHTLDIKAVFGHRDGLAIEGRFVSLQDLPEGTRATVTKALPKELIEAAKGDVAFEPEVQVKAIESPAPEVTAAY